MRRRHLLLMGGSALAVLACAVVLFFVLRNRGDAQTQPPSPTPAPTQTAAATPTPTDPPPSTAQVRLRAAGDVIMDTPMLESAYNKNGGYRFGRYFNLIKDQLADADLTVLNVEGSMGGAGQQGYMGYPSINTPPDLLDTLKKSGVDMLTLANNHALDRFFDGLLATVRNVDKAKLLRVGGYKSKSDFNTPQVVDVNGIQIGFANYTTGLNGMDAKSDKRAVEYGVRTTSKANFKSDIQAIRDAGAEVVVVFMHWDREYKHKPSNETKSLAKRLAQAGADVVIGSHSHMVQPIEWLETEDAEGNARKTLVVYSLGNFLTNHKGEFLDNGILFEVGFSRDAEGAVSVVEPRYLPVWVWVQKNGEERNYQVLPVGDTIDNRPDGMTDEQYARVTAAWNESVDLLGDAIAQPLRK